MSCLTIDTTYLSDIMYALTDYSSEVLRKKIRLISAPFQMSTTSNYYKLLFAMFKLLTNCYSSHHLTPRRVTDNELLLYSVNITYAECINL